MLSSILIQIIHQRLEAASSDPLPRKSDTLESETASPGGALLSEQAVMVLTLIDALPYLYLDVLEEWLDIAAVSISTIGDEGLRQVCRERFWEILSGGEIDVDRAAACVTWWTTKGGRQRVLEGSSEANTLVRSGGSGQSSKL
jgi:hypothetical protein